MRFYREADVKVLIEALADTHEQACECCDSKGSVKRHIEEAMAALTNPISVPGFNPNIEGLGMGDCEIASAIIENQRIHRIMENI
jgi:hypothetical protein